MRATVCPFSRTFVLEIELSFPADFLFIHDVFIPEIEATNGTVCLMLVSRFLWTFLYCGTSEKVPKSRTAFGKASGSI